ncbi:MAG: AAA family ATPase [Chitinophagales bacterium]
MISVYKDFDDVPKGLEEDGFTSKEVRERLMEIYHSKCVFTEVKTKITEITHFRPISLYPWLKKEWSNLLLTSPKINYRIDSIFPTENSKITTAPYNKKEWKANSETLLSEHPLLLHPEVDIPENHLYLDSDGIMYPYTEKGLKSIQVYQLNTPSLIGARKQKTQDIVSVLHPLNRIFNTMINLSKKNNQVFNNSEKEDNLIKKLFQLFFKDLENSAEHREPYSLVGKNIIERFEEIIITKFYQEDYKGFPEYPIILRKAYRQYILPPFVWKNKKLPYLDFLKNKSAQEKSIPIGITGLTIQKFHFIKKVNIEEIPIDTRWIFFTGENGFGKTLLLQSLYMACVGKKDGSMLLGDENSRFILHWKKYDSPELQIIGNANGTKFLNNYVVGYGANRLKIDGDVFEASQALEKVRKSDSLFRNEGSLYNILEYLINLHGHSQKNYQVRFDNIVAVLKELLPSIAAIEIDDSQVKKQLFFREKAENGDILRRIPFGALSAGNRSIIAMIGDMMVEFFKGQSDVNHPRDFVGIVIIDEIDIHLHPKWQRELVKRLTEIFPKIQFIASTHSSIPLLGAPKETLIFNVEKPNRKTGIQVRKLDIDISQLTPNTILSSPIFDFDEIIPESREKGEKLHTQDEYSEVAFEKKLDEKLAKLANDGGKSLEELLNLGDND